MRRFEQETQETKIKYVLRKTKYRFAVTIGISHLFSRPLAKI